MHKHNTAIIALIASSIIWGAAPPIFKWSLQGIEPFTLAFLRFFLASIILLLFIWHNKTSLLIHKHDIGKIILVGLIGISLNITAMFIGLKHAQSINAGVIGSSAPVFLMLTAIIVYKEKVKKKVIIGTTLGLIGVLIIVLQPIIKEGIDGGLFGNLCYIISTLTLVPYTFMMRELSKKYSYFVLLFWSFLIGSLSFFPFAFVEVSHGALTHITNHGYVGIIFGTLFSSTIAYSCYSYALKHVITNEVGLFLYIDPIISVLVAVPLLGEKLTFLFLAGSLLVFSGIFVAENRIHYHPLHKLKS